MPPYSCLQSVVVWLPLMEHTCTHAWSLFRLIRIQSSLDTSLRAARRACSGCYFRATTRMVFGDGSHAFDVRSVAVGNRVAPSTRWKFLIYVRFRSVDDLAGGAVWVSFARDEVGRVSACVMSQRKRNRYLGGEARGRVGID